MALGNGLSILIAGNDLSHQPALDSFLGQAGYEPSKAGSGYAALAEMESRWFDVVFVDVSMPDMGGLDLAEQMRIAHPQTHIVVVTEVKAMALAVEAMKRGASDCIARPFEFDHLAAVLEQLERERATCCLAAGSGTGSCPGYRVEDDGLIVGDAPCMRRVFETVEAVKDSRCSVLIYGESGTGKELIARAVHQNGNRKGAPFVAVNCASITRSLMESELFGHVRGAFTGATRDSEGYFRAAHGGTLFLDELTEIGTEVQAKLLRAIQERKVRPVGSTKSIDVDVRIVASTNRDLAESVWGGVLREDLYYRLNVISIALPPLRDRKADIEVLIRHFQHTFAREYGVTVKTIAPEAMLCLANYPWPGNVRELENLLERLYALDIGPSVDVRHLPEEIRGASVQKAVDASRGLPTLDEAEKGLLERALAATNGNKSEAARLLDVNRQRLYRMMARFGIA